MSENNQQKTKYHSQFFLQEELLQQYLQCNILGTTVSQYLNKTIKKISPSHPIKVGCVCISKCYYFLNLCTKWNVENMTKLHLRRKNTGSSHLNHEGFFSFHNRLTHTQHLRTNNTKQIVISCLLW